MYAKKYMKICLNPLLQPYYGGNLQRFDGTITRPLSYVHIQIAFGVRKKMKIVR